MNIKPIDTSKKIKILLIERDLTLSKFAQELGIGVTYLSYVINKKRKAYQLREKIAAVLQVPYESLWPLPQNNNEMKAA